MEHFIHCPACEMSHITYCLLLSWPFMSSLNFVSCAYEDFIYDILILKYTVQILGLAMEILLDSLFLLELTPTLQM
jgi:hypothetical protein